MVAQGATIIVAPVRRRRGTLSASATTPSHLRPGERPARDGGAVSVEVFVVTPGTAGTPSLASPPGLRFTQPAPPCAGAQRRRGTLSASATTPSHLRPGERPATDGGAESPEVSVAAPGTAGMPSLASPQRLRITQPAPPCAGAQRRRCTLSASATTPLRPVNPVH